jgi:hypothetical protein
MTNRASQLATLVAVTALGGVTQVAAQNQSGKPAAGVSASATITATVAKIDKAGRWVTLKRADGSLVDIEAGPEVKNFDQIKVGDIVTADRKEMLAIAVVPGEGVAPAMSGGSAMTTAPPGTKPMVVAVETASVSGKITAIDHAKRTVTVVGPKGNSHTLEVGPEVKRFDEMKTGDNIVVTVKTATAIEVTSPPKGSKPAG